MLMFLPAHVLRKFSLIFSDDLDFIQADPSKYRILLAMVGLECDKNMQIGGLGFVHINWVY